jgi:hypothetical protein
MVMGPVGASDARKPLATLRACLEAVNQHGAVGTLRWADGFAIPLGTIVYLEQAPISGTAQWALVYAVLGFEEGGEHHSGYHVHRIVNWAAEDPPVRFEVIDDDGRTLEFALLVPSCDDAAIADLAAWRAQLAAKPTRRDERYGDVQAALTRKAEAWAAQAAEE